MPHIFKFLGVQDIKKCRLVCKSWHYFATPVLKANSMTLIPCYPVGDDNNDILERLVHFCPVNIHLEIECPIKCSKSPRNPKMFPNVTNLKSIFISYPTKKLQWQTTVCKKLIANSASTLERLSFQWSGNQLDFAPVHRTVFPKLRELEIFKRSLPRYEDLERIGQVVIESFPALESLKIDSGILYKISKLGVLPKLPLSLKSLEMKGYSSYKQMYYLLNIRCSLKTLVLDRVKFDDIGHRVDELPTILYSVLKTFSPTLEKLSIDLRWWIGGKQLEWKFPVFPVMKRLRVVNNGVLEKIAFENPCSDVFGRIDYKVCFPVLESLHVCIEAINLSPLDAFLPMENNGCSMVVDWVKEIDIRRIRLFGSGCSTIDMTTLEARVLNIFPNARRTINIS
ncbi:uncharacterized protein LOC118433306 isoform X2 [Folsomia candida]|nr:uncharacterized protein LOC118433306 isoform X2 [Folsomia candida]